MAAPCGGLDGIEAQLDPFCGERLEQETHLLAAREKGIAVRSGLRLGVKSKLQLDLADRMNLIGDDENIGLDEEDMADEPFEPELRGVGGRRIAGPVVERGRRLDMEDRRLSLEAQQLSAVEPLLSLAQLAVSADEKRIVLTGPLGLVSII